MNVSLFGATAMVGSGVVLECLDDSRVESILVVGRSNTGISHAKIREILHADLLDIGPIQARFAGADACFFCLGVSAAGMSEAACRRITHDVTITAASAILAVGPRPIFCYVSGAGTDSTGRGRVMWARVKGQTGNDLQTLPFRAAYMFRPAHVQPRQVTTTVNIGRAMIEVVARGHPTSILRTADINQLAATAALHG